MHIKELHVQRFRGFSDLIVNPKGHVVAMGEPAAGRSDLIEALARVLDTEASRSRLTTELDFHNQDTSLPIQVSVTVGELGPDLEQLFFDHLEFWDKTDSRLVTESETPEGMDQTRFEWVLRLEYLARWLSAEERSEEWVHYPKESDPDTDSFVHARRRDLEGLGFAVLHWGTGRILDLSTRSSFRRVINRSEGNDFAPALSQYVEDVGQAAGQFTNSSQVKEALQDVFEPLRSLLGIKATDLSQVVKFAPDGGSTSGLLRSLGPSFDLGDGSGDIPAWRRGSTTGALLRIAEALALSSSGNRIVAIDDLGDSLDSGSAAHLAFTVRKSAGQAWVTTRIPSVAEVFEPQEVVRFGKDASGGRMVRQGKRPGSKVESLSAKHWHRNLLPALSYRSVIVVEGPNDFAAFHSLASRLAQEQGKPLPVTLGVSIISAGATGSGGYANVIRLAGAAKDIGVHSVAVVDGDPGEDTKKFLADNQELPNAVIRLPEGAAIELALLNGLEEEIVRQAFCEAALSAGIALPTNLDQFTGHQLTNRVLSVMKNNSLHAQFVEALPTEHLPPLATQVLSKALQNATTQSSGVTQL